MGALKTILAAIPLLLGVSILWFFWSGDSAAPERPAEDMTLPTARVVCQQHIASALHDPRSAEWGSRSDGWYARWPAAEMAEPGRYRVDAQFRARNAFGALVRVGFVCELERAGGDWRLVGLTQI